jgi:hypothetical protein
MTKRDDRALTGPVKPAPSFELGIPTATNVNNPDVDNQ